MFARCKTLTWPDELSLVYQGFFSSRDALFAGPFQLVCGFHPTLTEASLLRWSLQCSSIPASSVKSESELSDASFANCTDFFLFGLTVLITRMLFVLLQYAVSSAPALRKNSMEVFIFCDYNSRECEDKDRIVRRGPSTRRITFSSSLNVLPLLCVY